MKHQIIIAGLIAMFSIGSAYADGDHNYPYYVSERMTSL